MTRQRKGGDMLDRKVKALTRLRRTKAGREIVDQHREAFLHVLCDAVGKP